MTSPLTQESARALIARIYDADHALDAKAFVTLLSPQAVFQLGGSPPLRGRDQIRSAVTALFYALKSIRHRLVDLWLGNGKLVFQGEVNFTFPDGRSLLLTYVDVLTVGKDGLIDDYRIHIDLTPMNTAAHPPPDQAA